MEKKEVNRSSSSTSEGFFSLGLEDEIRDSKLIIHRARVPDCGQDKE